MILCESLGGEAAVDIFYRKVLSDDRISHFFDDVDMERQAAKQKAFLTYAFGGPNHYIGKPVGHCPTRHTHIIGHLSQTE